MSSNANSSPTEHEFTRANDKHGVELWKAKGSSTWVLEHIDIATGLTRSLTIPESSLELIAHVCVYALEELDPTIYEKGSDKKVSR